ncbi:MAG: hypothetical protein HXS52_11840 [Theionarchaea archaeon]|nr:hypothetical protein [Theionarchaea archaeon]
MKVKKWKLILIDIICFAIIASTTAYYIFPKDTKSEDIYVFLNVYFDDRGENDYDENGKVQQVFLLYQEDHTRVLMYCCCVHHPQDIDFRLLLEYWNPYSLSMDFPQNETLKFFIIPLDNYSDRDLLFRSEDDLEKEFPDFQMTRDPNKETGYFSMSSVEDKIMERNFWICFDVEPLEFGTQAYVHVKFNSWLPADLISLWVDEKHDIVLSFPPGKPSTDHVNFDVYGKFQECTIKVRETKRFNEAWFVAVFATLITMTSYYPSINRENGQTGEMHERGHLNPEISPFLISLISAIFVFIISSRDNFVDNSDNTRYMLSALVQSEAAIIAIFVTIGLVGVQLAGVYSPALAKAFRTSNGLKGLVFLYIFSISLGLYILGAHDSTPAIYIRLCFSLGVFCFVAFALYAFDAIEMTEPTRFIEKQCQKINGCNIFQKDDPIQSIFDIIGALIRKYDERTAIYGLDKMGEGIELMLKNEKFEKKEEIEVSNKIRFAFKDIGILAFHQGNENVVLEVLERLESIGNIAIENDLEIVARKSAESLGSIGETIVTKQFLEERMDDSLVAYNIQETEKIALSALEKGYKAATVATRKLGIIGEIAIKRGFGNVTHDIIESLEEITKSAGKRKGKTNKSGIVISNIELDRTIGGAVEYINSIAKNAVELKYEDISEHAIHSLEAVIDCVLMIDHSYTAKQVREQIEKTKHAVQKEKNRSLSLDLEEILRKLDSA